jgi:hypothetical protein
MKFSKLKAVAALNFWGQEFNFSYLVTRILCWI